MRAAVVCISCLSTLLSAVSILYLAIFVHDIRVFHGQLTTVSYKPNWTPTLFSADYPLINNLLLVLIFALQHSVFARPSVRATITKALLFSKDHVYPSFYAIGSSIALLVMFICWSPIPGTLWSVQQYSWLYYAILAANVSLCVLTFVSILSIHRFQLCGAEPLVEFLFGRIRKLQNVVKEDKKLVTSGMYGLVRHPTMLFLILSMWIVPVMSVGQLVFSFSLTVYIIFAVKVYEEPQLLNEYGMSYVKYKEQVSCQLFPGLM